MSSHENHPSGLDDEAVKEAHDFIHHADSIQHEHDAEAKKSGLPDSAVEAEHEFEDMVEGSGEAQKKSKPLGEKVKETLEKLVPGSK
ncbi:hypothetical protein BDV96DRAFT_639554 [Lophiotrema nucula]|uniref:Uncharacterized protein n=1 Tax=Lophiotrema nucula TaxID=690887 RepID=A0A6A5ZVU2_9PLEO|nr:hypothetical protein BDV96DRAFT_639554 [Lophiotrema nucula]